MFLQVQLIESVVSDLDLENKLWEREKYWQCQLFTNTHGMNSVSDLYASKRKGCRKKCLHAVFGCPVPLLLRVNKVLMHFKILVVFAWWHNNLG